MSYATTYEELRDVAALALGLTRAALDAADETLLNQVPNDALSELSQARRWKHLQRDLRLTCTAGQGYVLLPADFHQFAPDAKLAYGPNAGYAALCWAGVGHIDALRGSAVQQAPPTHAAVGATLDSLATISASPTGSGSFSGTYVYRYTHDTADGRRLVSGLATAAPSSKASVTVSGWDTLLAGTVTIYRTSSAGTTLQLLASLSGATATYADSIADGSLGTARFPDDPRSTADLDDRIKLELWPTPDAAHVLAAQYIRRPALMSAGTDKPDLPLALTQALQAATRVAALRKWARPVPDNLTADYERLLAQAEQWLTQTNPANHNPLRSRRGPYAGLPRGEKRNLDPSWS